MTWAELISRMIADGTNLDYPAAVSIEGEPAFEIEITEYERDDDYPYVYGRVEPEQLRLCD